MTFISLQPVTTLTGKKLVAVTTGGLKGVYIEFKDPADKTNQLKSGVIDFFYIPGGFEVDNLPPNTIQPMIFSATKSELALIAERLLHHGTSGLIQPKWVPFIERPRTDQLTGFTCKPVAGSVTASMMEFELDEDHELRLIAADGPDESGLRIITGYGVYDRETTTPSTL